MLLRVIFKTPDCYDSALEDLSEEEKEKALIVLNKFVKFNELITVEFDTNLGIATVRETK